ncbi:MAG: TVP38/TMEM64 family protein, partial [Planctomycetaceae bacterium]|nr:TVP38/TMEM64 family protein [Planctomycetaceae bacterium]
SALERDGAFYLFLLRLVPVIPFFVINIVMGLTPIRLRTFWWVSQLGMLPGTFLFVAAGASVPTLQNIADQGISGILSLKVIAAFSALGLMPLVARRIFLGRRAWQTSTASHAAHAADGTANRTANNGAAKSDAKTES